MNVFGMKFDNNVVMALFVIAVIYGITLLTSCSRMSWTEGMALLNHKMGEGVYGSYDTRELKPRPTHDTSKSRHTDEHMYFFEHTYASKNACVDNPTGYSIEGPDGVGCPVMTDEQYKVLTTRGGNRASCPPQEI